MRSKSERFSDLTNAFTQYPPRVIEYEITLRVKHVPSM